MTAPDDDELLRRLRAVAGFDLQLPEIREILANIPDEVDRADEVGRVVVDAEGELAGVRDATPSRHVTIAFRQGSLTIEVRPDGRIEGQVPEAWESAAVDVETLSATEPLDVDDLGLFAARLPGPGPFRLRAHLSGRDVTTSWLLR